MIHLFLRASGAIQSHHGPLVYLKVYNIALMIYKDVRVKEAMKIIDKYISYFNRQPDKDDTDKFLIELYEGMVFQDFVFFTAYIIGIIWEKTDFVH